MTLKIVKRIRDIKAGIPYLYVHCVKSRIWTETRVFKGEIYRKEIFKGYHSYFISSRRIYDDWTFEGEMSLRDANVIPNTHNNHCLVRYSGKVKKLLDNISVEDYLTLIRRK